MMNPKAYWLGFLFLLTIVSVSAIAFRASANSGPILAHSVATSAHLERHASPFLKELNDHAPSVSPDTLMLGSSAPPFVSQGVKQTVHSEPQDRELAWEN